MYRFVALFALVAVAVADPEAQFGYGYPYGYAAHPAVYAVNPHATAGKQVYSNGAVVPEDTVSVKAAKAQHFSAKANEYAKKSYYPYHAGVYGYPYASPLVHSVFKREAEGEADAQYVTPYGIGAYSPYYTGAYNYAGYRPYSAYSAYSPIYNTYGRLFKREAESDAQYRYITSTPYAGYSNFGYPYAGYNTYAGYSPYSAYHPYRFY